MLKWGRPFFGIKDRFGDGKSNLDKCWYYAGPGNEAGIPSVGQYFQTPDVPINVQRKGKYMDWIKEK